ncbi:hypothetical protein K1I93_09410, partial [Streptococcus australis]|uniref:hypothetical protein n=1 Tax=Streptococcus australis TaxID=113107 RepID=UPI001CBBB764
MKAKEGNIKTAIESVLKPSGDTPSRAPGTQTQRSDKTRQTLWGDFAKDIWNGMIYALTHKTETPGDVDEDVKRAFFGENNNKNPANPGTFESKYEYSKVVLKEENSDTPTTLDSFIKRPPYFRYLEEWGETFCRERKKRLEKIKGDCKVDENGKKQYSGFGEDCDDQLKDDPTNFKDLENASCANSCSSYRKWIKRKRKEYDKQSNAYSEQKTKCQTQSKDATSNNNANGFCGTLDEDAASFLEKLKNGPCSKINSAEDNGKGKKIFENTEKTFGHGTYCDPCSEFKINCQKANCTGGG